MKSYTLPIIYTIPLITDRLERYLTITTDTDSNLGVK